MAHFSYKAEKDGETYEGSAEAKDHFDLFQVVRREGGHIVSYKEEALTWTNVGYWNIDISRIGEYEKVLFARNLGTMLAAGLPLARALAVLERQTKNKRFAKMIAGIAGEVRRGETLTSALEKYPKVFSRIFVAMVRAGEEGGELPGSLSVIADQAERMHALKKKIRGALMYPSIVVIAMVGIGAAMMVVVVPTLADTFKEMNAELPTSTKVVIGISDFLTAHTVAAVVMVFLAIVSFVVALRTDSGRRVLDWVLLHTPSISTITREINAARTSRTLASLLASGVDVLTSLEITRDVVQNSYFKEVLTEALEAVGKGEPLSKTFSRNEQLYPAFVGEMMAVGEETGQTNEMLKRLAVFYEEEVDRKTKDLSTIIEPILMLVIGAGVGFFAVSMIAPIYSLSQNV